ncbi:hypothetical protein [Candidatus Mycoplasma haematominutum]|uniref:Uncharacterized protein n=1 Tax=Candidatus Mycoplasma haematominutum 'Birmingham 1' TaxID=1116213 RepID=G8C3P7_9MOLU|nr:hypothetical protein [Candidatus Mycoplasma haematominutum]CCE66945.1 hypothetical protein MHM_04270 [Candidatus Mycoplasma haematominutum 'Birmingham 1']
MEDICWESELAVQSEAEFNSLLSEEWGNARVWEEEYSSGDWKLSCESHSPGWDIWNTSAEGDETKEYYLGLCRGAELKDTLFVFKKAEKGNTTISVCRGGIVEKVVELTLREGECRR